MRKTRTEKGLYSIKGLSAILLAAVLSSAILYGSAEAVPIFARQVGRNCTYCHTLIPKLNETGRTFRANGFRFEAEGEWKEVKDLTMVPLSAEVAIEASYDKVKASGVETESSDMAVEEVELFTGGAFGKTGKASAFAIVSVMQSDSAGTTSYRTIIEKAFVQVNDILGPAGSGALNVRAGQSVLGLPFLDDRQKYIDNRYLLESTLGALARGQRAVELNGQVLGDEDTFIPTHRYSAGVAREDINGENKLKGYYLSYALTFKEAFSIGALYRGGKEKDGVTDVSYHRYGGGAEAEIGPVIMTAAYFRAERENLPDREDYMAEALLVATPKIAFGGRYEVLKESGKRGVKSLSAMARYGIISGVFAQAEFQGLDDGDHVTGTNEDEKALRLFLVALF